MRDHLRRLEAEPATQSFLVPGLIPRGAITLLLEGTEQQERDSLGACCSDYQPQNWSAFRLTLAAEKALPANWRSIPPGEVVDRN